MVRQRIDLIEAHRLVSMLEQDLQRVEEGQGDLSALREEAKALSALLASPSPDHGRVAQDLHAIHGSLVDVADTAVGRTARVADYITRIGHMLGM